MKLPTADQFESLRRLDACTLANAIELFHKRLRNEGFVDNSIHCLFPRLEPMLGYAATITIRGSAPPMVNGHTAERTDWWDYVLSLPAPRVLVVEDKETHTGLGSLLGAVHVNILRALGCAGAVTNGSVRDIPEIEALGFPLFASSVAVSHAYVRIIEFGQPVEIGGLRIKSGDLLHGDIHGVQMIPLEIVSEIPAAAGRIAAREEKLIALCRSPEFSLEKLRDAFTDGKS